MPALQLVADRIGACLLVQIEWGEAPRQMLEKE